MHLNDQGIRTTKSTCPVNQPGPWQEAGVPPRRHICEAGSVPQGSGSHWLPCPHHGLHGKASGRQRSRQAALRWALTLTPVPSGQGSLPSLASVSSSGKWGKRSQRSPRDHRQNLLQKLQEGLNIQHSMLQPQAWSEVRGLISKTRVLSLGILLGLVWTSTRSRYGTLLSKFKAIWTDMCPHAKGLSVSSQSGHVTLCPWNLPEVSHSSHSITGFGFVVSF